MEEEKGKRRTRFLLRLLAAFLVAMAVMALASRAAASFVTARVSAEAPAERRISHPVYGEGVIEPNRELPILTEPGILVETIYAREGDRVEKGGLIAVLEPQSLERRIWEAGSSEERERLIALREDGGEVTSPVAGTITGVSIEVGQKTTDTAAATITDDASGLRFVGSVPAEDASWLSAGDEVSLSAGGRTAEGLEAASVDFAGGEGGGARVTVMLEPGTFSIGEAATLYAEKQSEAYPLTVPTGALHVDKGSYFVYALGEEETVLGTELEARRVDVRIIEQGQSYAAVESPLLGTDILIVTGSDDFLSAGDRVRLQEP